MIKIDVLGWGTLARKKKMEEITRAGGSKESFTCFLWPHDQAMRHWHQSYVTMPSHNPVRGWLPRECRFRGRGSASPRKTAQCQYIRLVSFKVTDCCEIKIDFAQCYANECFLWHCVPAQERASPRGTAGASAMHGGYRCPRASCREGHCPTHHSWAGNTVGHPPLHRGWMHLVFNPFIELTSGLGKWNAWGKEHSLSAVSYCCRTLRSLPSLFPPLFFPCCHSAFDNRGPAVWSLVPRL